MKSTMHFLDGNDPSHTPGAIVIYPTADPQLAWDSENKCVLDTSTGERFELQITDREYRSFLGGITHPERATLEVGGYFGQYDRPGLGKHAAYSVEFVRRPLTSSKMDLVSYPIARIAKFLNHYGHPYDRKNSVGNVVVIGMPDQESDEP